MQPLFRPMEGHQQHFGAFHHHVDMSTHRINSTPISDDDELDIDDSASLSSNADGSCPSPAGAHNDKTGLLFVFHLSLYNLTNFLFLLLLICFKTNRRFIWCRTVAVERRSQLSQLGRFDGCRRSRSPLPHGFHPRTAGPSREGVPSRELRVPSQTLRAGRSTGPPRIDDQGKFHIQFNDPIAINLSIQLSYISNILTQLQIIIYH